MGILEEGRQEYAAKNSTYEYLREWGYEVSPDTGLFEETAEVDGMPAELFVRHDLALVNKIDRHLGKASVGLTSPYGSGKTALREILLRELSATSEYVMVHIGGGASETKRGILARGLRALLAEGYEFDADEYGQIVDGIPWKTEEVLGALRQITEEVERGHVTRGGETVKQKVIIIADQIEKYDKEQLEALQNLNDIGIRLLIMGVPEGKENVRENKPALHTRTYWLDDRIDPFKREHVAEYIARSLAYATDSSFDGEIDTGPFTEEAITEITERTSGNPRLVRFACLYALEVAAAEWDTQDVDAEDMPVIVEHVAAADLSSQAAVAEGE